jgi:alkylation response protein AidB-like acyl-CoA dehydrogenase
MAVTETSAPDEIRAELLGRARQLLPEIAARAEETERLRMLPQETADAFVDSGLLRIPTPKMWGGWGLEYDTFWEVGTILGEACGSTAWCYAIAGSHNWQMGLASEQAQADYFSTPDQWSSSAFHPPGKLERVEGGWTFSGRWSFSSGCDHANWGLLSGYMPEIEGMAWFMVPREQWRIEDDWHTSGLRGTGSKTIVIDEPVFLPAHRFSPMSHHAHPEARDMHGRGSYGVPFWTMLPWTVVSPIVGMAQGMLGIVTERMTTKVNPATGELYSLESTYQAEVAEAAATIDAARCVARVDIGELIDRGLRGDTLSLLDRARYRRDHAFVVKLCVDAANRLYAATGGTAIYDASPIQRFHRDIHAASHHIAVDWLDNAERWGKVRFGLELPPPGRY